MTTVAEEKKLNPRLSKPKEQFLEIMKNLGLAYPKKIGIIFNVSSIKYKYLIGLVSLFTVPRTVKSSQKHDIIMLSYFESVSFKPGFTLRDN